MGIKSYGVYVPRLRMVKGAIADAHAWALPNLKTMARGERALCSWDEDSITMAVQAARDCLEATLTQPAALSFASTTAPFADLLNATVIARALRLTPEMPCQDSSGSTRAGLRSLAQ